MALEILNALRTGFDARNRAGDHEQAQLEIHIAEPAVSSGGDNGFAYDMRQIRAHHKIHRHPERKQSRAGQKASAHSKKAAEHPDHKPGAH